MIQFLVLILSVLALWIVGVALFFIWACAVNAFIAICDALLIAFNFITKRRRAS